MKKLIITMMMFSGVSTFAHSGKSCGKCYHSYPAIYSDMVENFCLTKLGACSIKADRNSFFFQYDYEYKQTRVLRYTNGKVVRLTEKDKASVGTFVDLAELKNLNADVAVGDSKDKIIDERDYSLRECKVAQDEMKKKYKFCK